MMVDVIYLPRGIRYWFEEKNSRDADNPHKVQILVKDKQVIDYSCSCKHGGIQIDSKFKGGKKCTHLKNSFSELEKQELI